MEVMSGREKSIDSNKQHLLHQHPVLIKRCPHAISESLHLIPFKSHLTVNNRQSPEQAIGYGDIFSSFSRGVKSWNHKRRNRCEKAAVLRRG